MEQRTEKKIRPPAVANTFYPGNPSILRTQIRSFLDEVESDQIHAPKAIIAPHAGYIYSGPIAAFAYKPILLAKTQIKRVVFELCSSVLKPTVAARTR